MQLQKRLAPASILNLFSHPEPNYLLRKVKYLNRKSSIQSSEFYLNHFTEMLLLEFPMSEIILTYEWNFLPDQVPAEEIRISSTLLLNPGFKSNLVFTTKLFTTILL